MDSSDLHREPRTVASGNRDVLTSPSARPGGKDLPPEVTQSSGTALNQLFRSQYRQLLRLCRMRIGSPADAEDIVQGAFLAARRAYPDKEIDELRPLLFTLVRNNMLNHLRAPWNRRRSGEDVSEAGDQLACPRSPTPEKQLADAQRLAIVEEVLAGMSPRRQAALRMHRFEGLSYEEIARRLSISATAVKKHVALAVAEIATRLAEAEGPDGDPAG
jgi:RNA polymerase sigma-70 factor (ECF subfamily)